MIISIPKKSLKNLVIFTVVLAVVIGLMVVPSYLAIEKSETARSKIKSEVDEQRQLAPVFGKLIKKSREIKTAGTRLPTRTALARETAGSFNDELTRLATNNRLQVAGLTLDLNALVNESRLMQVDMVLRGQLSDYRDFLEKLIAVPHLSFIERLRIKTIPDGREYGMRLWIALK